MNRMPDVQPESPLEAYWLVASHGFAAHGNNRRARAEAVPRSAVLPGGQTWVAIGAPGAGAGVRQASSAPSARHCLRIPGRLHRSLRCPARARRLSRSRLGDRRLGRDGVCGRARCDGAHQQAAAKPGGAPFRTGLGGAGGAVGIRHRVPVPSGSLRRRSGGSSI